MTTESSELTIRLARADDRAAMESICARIWDDGDYVPSVWDRWLVDERGPLIVGTLEGQVVALNKITFQTPEQVWLQAMRVDPDYHQRGIGTKFLEYSLRYAREHGARVARLSTSARNAPVHLITARAGMERINIYVLWVADSLGEGPEPTVLSPADLSCVLAFLQGSQVLEACHGVYEADWAWQELSPDRLADLLHNQQIVAKVADDGRPAALAIVNPDPEDQALGTGFIDGESTSVTELALAIRVHAGRLGAAAARAWLPEVAWLRQAFQAAGYGFGEWHAEMWLLERRFDPKSEADRAA